MTEYIIIVALVAIAAIGVVSLFGENLRQIFAGAANALAGETTPGDLQQKSASQTHTEAKTLKTFGSNVQGSAAGQ
jgi:Flp pilus assembly pilin Flp